MPEDNLLMIDSSEDNADLYFATRFIAPDSFVFVRIRGKKYILINDLEIDRAKKQARVDAVLSTSKLARAFKATTGRSPSLTDILGAFLKKKKVRDLLVPANFQVQYCEPLKRAGFRIRYKPLPFCGGRILKDRRELGAIRQALVATERAAGKAVQTLKKSVIRGNKLYFHGKPLTSEFLKTVIHRSLLEDGCTGEHTIVSCGPQTVDPHHRGSGPLKAHQPIVMDIFPRNDTTRYYADFTRTVVRGKASPRLKKIYAAVEAGQEIAFRMIRDSIDGKKVHDAIQEYFTGLGFRTGFMGGRAQGFFHSTGHGLGLEVHESPRIGRGSDVLKEGQVVTVEPGLYYKGTGGVRLEDVVVVTKKGCTNLTKFPKFLEI